MALTSWLDKGASLGRDAPCLTAGETTHSYGQVQEVSWRVARALARSGVRPGQTVAVLSANDPVAFSCVFGIARAGAVWAPVNPRNQAAENQELLELFGCTALVFQAAFAPLVAAIRGQLPALTTLVCLDSPDCGAPSLEQWLAGVPAEPVEVEPVDDVAMVVGTGGTTGRPKGVLLTSRSIETMSAITLMSYPFEGRPVYLALAPLTHAAGVLCFPVMALGGHVVVLRTPSLEDFLDAVPRHRVTHTFLPPTLVYLLLDHPRLDVTDRSSLQCFWYGAAPISAARLEEALHRIGPMAQLFGQSEAPMMVSTMAPADHWRPDGTVATERLTSAGRPSPLVTVAIMAEDGGLLPAGERGEIVVRGSLVMAGYLGDPAATEAASAHGWHHTGDIGYLDDENWLYVVDRAKDMIISGGFNVYSAEVENALLAHPDVADCAVIGVPDEKWGERVVAVVLARPGSVVDAAAVTAFVKERIGSVKAPKELHVWTDLPRSTVGKVLKTDVRTQLLAGST